MTIKKLTFIFFLFEFFVNTTQSIFELITMSQQANADAKQIFHFLCGNFAKISFIYAIKVVGKPWHYFEEQDSLSSMHTSLPRVLDSLINKMMVNEMKTVEVPLNNEQQKNYYVNEIFVFKKCRLKTYKQLTDEKSKKEASYSKSSYKYTHQLVFISGQSNPLLFLDEFEKCRDLKDDKDKMFKIRSFVDAPHRAEINSMYFTSDWPRVRQTFIKKYSSSFTENKKRELHIDFEESTSLRSFIELKLKSLASYTTLPFLNQMEMVLADLPNSISKLFLVNEIMTSSKAVILEFCDSIQDLVHTMREQTEPDDERSKIQNPLNALEIFTYDSELESLNGSVSTIEPGSSGRVKTDVMKRRIIEDARSDLSLLDDSSQSSISSTMSVDSVPKCQRGTVSGSSKNVVKKRRGRPRKNLVPIPEESMDSATEYLNETVDSSSTQSRRFQPY